MSAIRTDWVFNQTSVVLGEVWMNKFPEDLPNRFAHTYALESDVSTG